MTFDGLPVKGYQPQTAEAVALVNESKEIEETVLRFLDMLGEQKGVQGRWLAIARTMIEQGFMAANRAVFRPSRVKLRGDPPAPDHGA